MMQGQGRLGTPSAPTAHGAEPLVWMVLGERWSRAVGQGDMDPHSPSAPGLSPGTEFMLPTAKPKTYAGPVVSEVNGKD